MKKPADSIDKKPDLLLRDLVTRKEENGLQFYRECLKKTNQFSAKYILSKVIEEYEAHVKSLGAIFKSDDTVPLPRDIVNLIQKNHTYTDIISAYDLTTLTHIEAIKLGLQMTSRDIEFYNLLKDQSDDGQVLLALEKIISQKTDHLTSLQDQFERLNYENGK